LPSSVIHAAPDASGTGAVSANGSSVQPFPAGGAEPLAAEVAASTARSLADGSLRPQDAASTSTIPTRARTVRRLYHLRAGAIARPP
jgi:hypothetical protein